MTLSDIRTELVTKTERKIQEMKTRSITLPKRRVDMCELCDQLSQEIYDFAVNTTIQIADRNHLRSGVAVLLDELQEDILALTNGALDVVIAVSTKRNTGAGGSSGSDAAAGSGNFKSRGDNTKFNALQTLCNRVRSWWGYKQATYC